MHYNPNTATLYSTRICIFTLFFAFLLGLTVPAGAIILHKDEFGVIAAEPAVGERPDNSVVGRWSSNASAVVVGRVGWETTCYVLTARHQKGGEGTIVTIDNVQYRVATGGVYNVPGVDLRLCRLENLDGSVPNLTDFSLLNFDSEEVGKDIVMGGCGDTVGNYATDAYGEYYTWASSDGSLHWGKNSIDNYDSFSTGDYTSDTIISAFEGPRNSTTEAAIGDHDSGGGWFYQDGDDWYVAGISAYTSFGKSYFSVLNKRNIAVTYDQAVRVSSYAEQLDSAFAGLYPSIPGDANLDGDVDVSDLGILATYYGTESGAWWERGDFNMDGAVDVSDLGILASNYGISASGLSSGNFVPEPATISLLSLGTLTLIRRRRR